MKKILKEFLVILSIESILRGSSHHWWRRVEGERMNAVDIIHLILLFMFFPFAWIIVIAVIPAWIGWILFPLFAIYVVALKFFPISLEKISKEERHNYPRKGRRSGEYSDFFKDREPFWKNRELNPAIKHFFLSLRKKEGKDEN